MARRPARLPGKHIPRFDHGDGLALFDELIGSRYPRDAGADDADVGGGIFSQLRKGWARRVRLGMHPDGCSLAGGVEEGAALGRRHASQGARGLMSQSEA
jgi:hypothetical protein